jgi:hypothetical protein
LQQYKIKYIKIKKRIKSVDFAINVVQLNTHINNAQNMNINLHFVFTVEKKVILQDNVPKIKKDCIEKEDHALDADQFDIHWRTVRRDIKVVGLLVINNNFELESNLSYF